jgi:hypothetical protein
MNTTTMVTLATLAFVPAALMLPGEHAGATTVEIADGDVDNAVHVSNVSRRGDVVVGTLTNDSDAELRDIRLLIDVAFLWTNEVKPGEESPGRSAVMTVAGPLAPHGKLAFEFTPNPPLPERTDGRYADPKVRIMGYQSVASR